MNFEMPVVIDEDILDELVEFNSNQAKFFFFYLQENNTKCVILKSAWNKFCKKWETQLKDAPENKEIFLQLFSGIVRPYRKEGHEDENEEKSPIRETIKIINRDYDIVKYLIVKNKENYVGNEIKISDDNIMSLKEFYATMEVSNSEIFKEFTRLHT